MLRKTAIIIMIISATLLILAGCGNETPEQAAPSPTPAPTAAPAAPTPTPTAAPTSTPEVEDNGDSSGPEDDEGFSFTINGVEIIMGHPAFPIIENLGEPQNYHESISCAFDGIDRSWYFNGFIVHAYPLGDEDFILSVILTDDINGTDRRIYLGMTYDDMVRAYGSDYERDQDQYLYRLGSTSLAFIMQDGYIGQITYRYEDAPELQ